MCSPHSNLACRGKHLHGCSVLTDKCHINMSQITFTPFQKPMYSHCQRLWKSFSEVCQLYMLTGLHTYKNCVNMADNSIIQPVWGRVFWPLFPTSDKINCMVRNIASAQNIVCGLQKGGLGTEGERVVPLFFPQDVITPQLRPPATQSHRSRLFTFTSHPHCALWSYSHWGAHDAVPTKPSAFYPHRNPEGIPCVSWGKPRQGPASNRWDILTHSRMTEWVKILTSSGPVWPRVAEHSLPC